MKKRNLTRACLSSSLLALIACGGGGSGTTVTTPPPSPPVSTNQAPNASATAGSASVTEGRQLVLSASGSTDAEGDSLTYSWEQIAGPIAAVSGNLSDIEITAEAPDVNGDTILTFQVTVSDGTSNSTDTVSITIKPLGFEFIDIFSNVIIPSSANSYKIFSGGTGIGQFNYTTQEFSSDGEPIGDVISGSLTPENNADGYVLSFEDVIQSGETTYNSFSFTLDTGGFGGPEEVGLSTLRGPIDQDFQTIGDIYASFLSEVPFQAHDAISIGEQDLATITILPRSAGRRDVIVHVITPDGTSRASTTLADQVLFPTSSELEKFDESTFAGFWLQNNQLNMQVMNADGDLVGTNIALNPIEGNFFTRIASVSLSSGNIATITDEGPNNDPKITLRVINPMGDLELAPTEIGKGTDPRVLSLNDGNILVLWNSLNTQFLGKVINPTGTFITDTLVFAPDIISGSLDPVQLEDGTVIIGHELNVLRFPIEDIGLFPVATN